MEILILILSITINTFNGFAIGRFGDKYGGNLNTPHHWIYGLILIIFGFINLNSGIGIASLFFGIGHFISDLDDFLNLKIIGVDEPHKWKFWSTK